MITNSQSVFSSYAVGVAAEAFAAGVLAHAGYDVSVQYGANRPNYDLVAVKNDRILQVSVKGSKDGGWGLAGGYKKGRTYQEAAQEWLRNQPKDVVFMLLQFQGISLGACPNVYIARPTEIAEQLKAARNGYGQSFIAECYTYKKGLGRGYTDRIPNHWKFSQNRIDTV